MVRMRLICVGEPAVVMPARLHVLDGVSFSVVRTRLGSSRSSKKMSRISSCVIVNSKSSSPSPESAACLPPWPSPERGFLISSPGVYSLLPGSTKSCSPPDLGSRRKRGSCVPLVEILILRSLPMSATAAVLQRFLHGFADLRARPAQEALPVGEALALGIETPVDEVGHCTKPVVRAPLPQGAPQDDGITWRLSGAVMARGRDRALSRDDMVFTPPCSRACTTRPAGGPGAACSRA